MEKLSRIKRLFWNTVGIAIVLFLFWASYRATQIDFPRLARDAYKARDFVMAFLSPDVVSRDVETTVIALDFPVPCGSAPAAEMPDSGPRLVADVPCAEARQTFTIEGFDLLPNSEVNVSWLLPEGGLLRIGRVTTDADGHFLLEAEVRPIVAAKDGVASQITAETLIPVGPLKPSQALKDVIREIFVTIFMALLSTTIATIIAAPLSFLAASNITRRGALGTVVYYLARSFFNLIRSFEPLVMASVFAFWLGYGPFAGSLALTVVTTASLGKLFSEAVESIDSGPIEALQATGANRMQTVLYAVVPQIVPDFISFIVYHWDINVRISTVIGFVGGGGIGYYLNEQINSMVGYHRAGTAIWAIILVVWLLDFLSAEVRKRLT